MWYSSWIWDMYERVVLMQNMHVLYDIPNVKFAVKCSFRFIIVCARNNVMLSCLLYALLHVTIGKAV